MGRADSSQVGERSTRRIIGSLGKRQRARVVLGWVAFEPHLQSQLVEAEALVHSLPREAAETALLRLAFLARDRELLDVAIKSARQAESK